MRAAAEVFPALETLVGVEPDERVVTDGVLPRGHSVRLGRFADVALEPGIFDLVFSSHTLEHAASASGMLRKTWECLRPGGHHFLEVPSLENITDPGLVEEFFIDKHRFHFSRRTLIGFAESCGFDVVAGANSVDAFNVTLLLRKPATPPLRVAWPAGAAATEAEVSESAIHAYARRLEENRGRLRQVAREVERWAGECRVVFWGGGRIFDAMVRFGGLDTSRISYAVDSFIGRYLSEFHGVPIVLPERLEVNPPQLVIVLARSSTDEIESLLRRRGIDRILRFADLFAATQRVI